MTKTNKIKESESHFSQKKINHLFHYTKDFEIIQKIIQDGFAPSYCNEIIDDTDYYIPMVSFCNIPLTDVQFYMRYGEYGIGLTLDWAVQHSISPVVYIHHNTPFKSLQREINEALMWNGTNIILQNKIFELAGQQAEIKAKEEVDFRELLKKINNLTVPALQFFKNWKTNHKGKEIVTYQEREWRFIPDLENNKRLITVMDSEHEELKNETFKSKPHFPEYSLKIESIDSLKYIVIKNSDEREQILLSLKQKFGGDAVINSILSGNLLIVTSEMIHDDF